MYVYIYIDTASVDTEVTGTEAPMVISQLTTNTITGTGR